MERKKIIKRKILGLKLPKILNVNSNAASPATAPKLMQYFCKYGYMSYPQGGRELSDRDSRESLS